MADQNAFASADAHPIHPTVHRIGIADLKDALARGIADFNAKPSHVVFLCLIYPIVALVLIRLAAGYDMLPMIYPLIAGYALVGPVAAIGLYEMSRRREQGLDMSWRHAFGVLHSPSIRSIAVLAAVLAAIFVAWLGTAQAIYEVIFGGAVPSSFDAFAREVLTTSQGHTLIVVGTGAGFLFAVVSFTIGVVSFPMLLDRDVGAATAVQTSVRAVFGNPITMAVWGVFIAVSLAIGSLPFFVGLAVVLPVLGHSSWHLYRRVVAF